MLAAGLLGDGIDKRLEEMMRSAAFGVGARGEKVRGGEGTGK